MRSFWWNPAAYLGTGWFGSRCLALVFGIEIAMTMQGSLAMVEEFRGVVPQNCRASIGFLDMQNLVDALR